MPTKKAVLRLLVVFMLVGALFVALGASGLTAAQASGPLGLKSWYFAEGYTGPGFSTYILIENSNQNGVNAHLRFVLQAEQPLQMDLAIPGQSRQTVDLNAVPGLQNRDVSTLVTCDSEGIVVERSMYFSYGLEGIVVAGGHATIGASAPSTNWWLPEGCTRSSFNTYVLLQNPGTQDAQVELRTMLPNGGSYMPFHLTLPAQSRRTVLLDSLTWVKGGSNIIGDAGAAGAGSTAVSIDNNDVSTWVVSDKPIVAEQSLYYDYFGRSGGSNSIGAAGTSTSWYLAEGYTGAGFDTYILVQNPNAKRAKVTLSFYTNNTFNPGPAGTSSIPAPFQVSYSVAPYARYTLCLNTVAQLQGKDVATSIRSDQPVVAARSMYFNYSGIEDGDLSIGGTQAHATWELAEGYTGGAFDTYVLFMNPMTNWQKVTAVFLTPSGSPIARAYQVPPYARYTIHVDEIPGLEGTDVSTVLYAQYMAPPGGGSTPTQSAGIIAECSMYFVYGGIAGGSNSVGFGEDITGTIPEPTPAPGSEPPAPTPVPAGQGFTGSLPGAGAHTWNVKDYGATGNGSTDDVKAIQATIDAAAAGGGGIVSIPSGVYQVSYNRGTGSGYLARCLELKSNVHVVLDVNTEIRLIPNDSQFYQVFRIAGVQNASIRGGTITGDKSSHTGTGGEWGYGIAVLQSSQVYIGGLKVQGCWGDGIYVGKESGNPESQHVTIDGVTSDANRRQAVSVGALVSGVIKGSTLQGTAGTAPQDGIDLEPEGDSTVTVADMTITGNLIQGNAGDGIGFLSSDSLNRSINGITVTGNTLKNNQSGVTVIGSKCTQVAITNNRSESNRAAGIYIENITSGAISGNVVTGNGQNGIQACTARSANIDGNTISGNGENGIYMHGGGSNNRINGNQIYANAKFGFYTFYDNSETISSNNISGNSQLANAAYDNVAFVDTSSSSFSGNTVRAGDGANKARFGINIATSGCQNDSVTTNDLLGSGVAGALNDAGSGTAISGNAGY